MVFGDGPDGGREASHIGKVPYPNEADQWEGTIVLQAKFRQRATNSRNDTAWAASQLKDELEETFMAGSNRVRPTHFILATNVPLSSVPKKGGKARLESVASQFPLEGFHVWDRDKIESLLDEAEGVRNGFLGFICPGDVLAEIRKHVRSETPDFDKVISNFLEKELLSDQYANLEQAGRVADEKVPISQVFIDLPTQSAEEVDEGEEPKGLAEQLLEISAERLSPSLYDANDLSRVATAPHHPTKGRLVLIGGPGQGKTTLGQFVCQLFRASLLQSRPASRISPEAQSAMKLISSQCAEDGVELPMARRFPIRIPLTELSDSLASDDPPSTLLEFMVGKINQRVSRSLPTETLRTWLGEYPWLLVLDGLDEVPASSNRTAILELIRDFWVDAANEDADVLVLATTRPQGYNNDFSPKSYRHVTLKPLSPEYALQYGRRLAQARHGADEGKRNKVVERLEQATRSSATAKLMTSPLQVTIMATLVDRGGQPPRQRWNLFSEYYKVIYTREVEREISAAEVLKEHKPDIDAIHHRVALILQAEGEQAGQGDARMSAGRFARIVRQRLEEEGHEGEGLADLQKRIIKAAGDRLVFLVGLKENEVGFEIRSLQEFMAAEALMDGADEHVTARLRIIAGVTNWRNVFLFAAGKCYAERQHLRDTIYTICVELNDPVHDPLGPIVKPGSILATDLLIDGFSLNQPAHSQLLGKEALKLLSDPEAENRLLQAYQPPLEKAYRPVVESALKGGAVYRKSGLALLLTLSANKADWATELLDVEVPQDGDGLKEVLEVPGRLHLSTSKWMSRRIKAHGEELSMQDAFTFSREGRRTQLGALAALDRMKSESPARHRKSFPVQGPPVNGLSFTLSSITPKRLDRRAKNPKSWPGVAAAVRFAESPTSAVLATELRVIANAVPGEEWQALTRISPWPLGASLAHAEGDPQRLKKLADRAERGELGETKGWHAAEERWEAGVSREDLAYVPSVEAPFDASIETRGFPIVASGWAVTNTAARQGIYALVNWLDGMDNRESVKTILDWAIGLARVREIKKKPVPSAAVYATALLKQDGELPNSVDSHLLIQGLAWAKNPSDPEKRLLEIIGEGIGPISSDGPRRNPPPSEECPPNLLSLWNANHKTEGLYRIIALARPHADRGRRPRMAPPSESIARGNPGAEALLRLKERKWGGNNLERAVELLAEVAETEPLWLRAAARLFSSRANDPEGEKALALIWDVNVARTEDAGTELISQEIRRMTKDIVDRRATRLLEPEIWRELDFFKLDVFAGD